MTFFDNIELAPSDPILGITVAFAADPRPSKINLGVGTYKDEFLAPLVLPTVKKAERLIYDKGLHKEYLGIEGDKLYLEQVKELVFGKNVNRVVALQSVGGTGALRVGADFLKRQGKNAIYLPDPTWDNHKRIFTHSGFAVDTYPYYSQTLKRLDFTRMREAIASLPKGSVILLQGCCHNPTGFDPTHEEWKEIIAIIQKNALLPFIDFAYQGFGEGLEQDAWLIRTLASNEIEFLVASSYSKNFGLYAERTGALFLHCKSEKSAGNVLSQVKVVIRGIYSNPPCHGARIVATILSQEDLKKEWQDEVDTMRGRILEMRSALTNALKALSHSEFAFIEQQKGMFSYTGLNLAAVERLIAEHGIYLPKDGRINIAGINSENLNVIAEAIVNVIS